MLKVSNPKPNNLKLKDPNFVYIVDSTIYFGQPIPWGLNWLITYPTTFTFQEVRP